MMGKEGTLGRKLFTNLKKVEQEKRGNFTLTLTEKALTENMQTEDACFEACAVILKALGWEKIKLNLDDDAKKLLPDLMEKIVNRKENALFESNKWHSLRFLYRALRFSKQYESWFSLGDNIKGAVNSFEFFLTDNKDKLLNNCPSNSPAKKSPSRIESIVEEMLANEKRNDVFYKAIGQSDREAEVFRQLPVGLFEGSKAKGREIFPSNKAAVDLWTIDVDTVRIVELKAANPMVGVITEAFFYANFVRDLLDEIFAFNAENGDESRGYNKLRNLKKETTVQGVMLADSFDPLITDDVISVLKENGREYLDYIKASYAFDIKIPS